MIRLMLTLSLLLAPMGGSLAARSPGDIAEVRNGILAIAVGDVIQKSCGSISPRLIRTFSLRNQLVAAARSAGFTQEEIDAFVDDDVARAAYKAEAAKYLRQEGAVEGDLTTYCDVGKREIASNSAVGRLLRVR